MTDRLRVLRRLVQSINHPVNEARLLWPDSVALGVFLAFVTGLAMILSPFTASEKLSPIAHAYPALVVLLGTIFLLGTLWAVLSPLYGGLGVTLIYGAFALLSFTKDFNPLSLGVWLVWIALAVHGSGKRIAQLHKTRRRWGDILSFHAENTQMIPFYLLRLQDVSGVSGTGIVAEGCIFSNGHVALTWVTEPPMPTMTHFASLDDVKRIHGHDGKTIIAWADPRLLPPDVRVPPPPDPKN